MIWLTHIDFRLAPGKVHWDLPNHLMFIIVVTGSIWPFFSLFSNDFMSPMSETFYSELFFPNQAIICPFLISMLWELCRIKNESGERLSGICFSSFCHQLKLIYLLTTQVFHCSCSQRRNRLCCLINDTSSVTTWSTTGN